MKRHIVMKILNNPLKPMFSNHVVCTMMVMKRFRLPYKNVDNTISNDNNYNNNNDDYDDNNNIVVTKKMSLVVAGLRFISLDPQLLNTFYITCSGLRRQRSRRQTHFKLILQN